jgi:hypothetical protein
MGPQQLIKSHVALYRAGRAFDKGEESRRSAGAGPAAMIERRRIPRAFIFGVWPRLAMTRQGVLAGTEATADLGALRVLAWSGDGQSSGGWRRDRMARRRPRAGWRPRSRGISNVVTRSDDRDRQVLLPRCRR